MALKEMDNEVRMFGVLPAHGAKPIPVGRIPDGANQVIAYNVINNAIAIVYTIPANNTLYLSSASLSIDNAGAAAGRGRLMIYNAVPAQVYRIFSVRCLVGDGKAVGMPFLPPMELDEGWSIRIESSAVNVNVTGFIHGYRL